MNAWLLTWEGTDQRIDDSNRIIAILSGRRSRSFVQDLAEVLYIRERYVVGDMAYLVNRKKERQALHASLLRPSHGGLYVGGNPCVYARKVSELRVKGNEQAATETITWREPTEYKENERHEIEVVDSGAVKTVIRSLNLCVARDLSGRSGAHTVP